MSNLENKEKTKRIAKNTIFLYFRMLFLMLVSLYTSRVILSALGISDYGIYNVVGGFVAMFGIVSSALSGAASRFLNFEMGKGNTERLNTVFSTTVNVQVLLAIIIAVLCETVGLWYINNVMVIADGRLVAANWVFQFSMLNFCMNLITIPYNAAIIAHERMNAFAYVSIFEGLAKLGICFVIMWQPFDRLIFYAFLLFVIQFIVRMVYQIYCKRNFEECKYHFVIDKPLLKKMFDYSLWHLFGNTSAILKNQGVNMILNLFFGTAVNAAKGVSNQVLQAVQGFASNFMVAVKPQITQSYAKGDYAYMFKLVYQGARFAYYMMLVLSLPIFVNADYILHIWLKEVPPYATIFVQFSLIISVLDCFSRTLIHAQDATGNIRTYQIVVGGILLFNLPICYLFLWLGYSPVSSMVIALVVDILGLIARLVMIPRYIKEFKPLDYTLKVIIRCLIVSAFAAAIPMIMQISMPENFLSFLINCIVCLVSCMLFIAFVGLSNQERIMFKSKMTDFFKKRFNK